MTSYSGDEHRAARARGEGRSDIARVRAKSDAELERDIAGDPDFRDVPADWYAAAQAIMPASKRLLSLRLDTDVVDWFRAQGPGYQTRINAVLRAFVTRQVVGKGREQARDA
jgi:uncharacterized protein (DUF4415 family)